MAKSKRNNSVTLHGFLDMDNGTITEIAKEEEFVYNFENYIRQFNGKEVVLAIKETSELSE